MSIRGSSTDCSNIQSEHISMMETHSIYIHMQFHHQLIHPPSISLITRSYELASLLQLKFTQPRTSAHGRLLYRQLHVLLHPRLQPHFTKFITAGGAGRFIHIDYWSILMCGRVKLPTTIDRRREAWMTFLSLSPNHCYVMWSLNMHC